MMVDVVVHSSGGGGTILVVAMYHIGCDSVITQYWWCMRVVYDTDHGSGGSALL